MSGYGFDLAMQAITKTRFTPLLANELVEIYECITKHMACKYCTQYMQFVFGDCGL